MNDLGSAGVAFRSLVNSHQTLFSSGIHQSALFLPWHRLYLLEVENHLADWLGNDTFALNYYDWNHCQCTGTHQTGGWWDTSKQEFCNQQPELTQGQFVGTDGGFVNRRGSYPCGGGVGGTLASCTNMDNNATSDLAAFSASQYDAMRNNLEANSGKHNSGHTLLGSFQFDNSMGGGEAANDPLFMMHHAQVDNLVPLLWRNDFPDARREHADAHGLEVELAAPQFLAVVPDGAADHLVGVRRHHRFVHSHRQANFR